MAIIYERTGKKDKISQQEGQTYGTPYEDFANQSKYFNPNDMLERKGHLFSFLHLPTGKVVKLPAVVSSIQDNYTSNFRREASYGRMDPITTFQNTQRQISVSLKIPAGTYREAKKNHYRVTKVLSNMLYPTYKRFGDYRVLSEPPIIAIKHVQLISGPGKSSIPGYLVGTMSGLNINHNFEQGAYEDSTDGNDVYPKYITISFTFHILHDYDRGWVTETNDFPTDVAQPSLEDGGAGGTGTGPGNEQGKTIGIPKMPKDPDQEGGAPPGEQPDPSGLSDADREDGTDVGDPDSPPINVPSGQVVLGGGGTAIEDVDYPIIIDEESSTYEPID